MLSYYDQFGKQYQAGPYTDKEKEPLIRKNLQLESNSDIDSIKNDLVLFEKQKNTFQLRNLEQMKDLVFTGVRRNFIKDKINRIMVINRFYYNSSQKPDEKQTIFLTAALYYYDGTLSTFNQCEFFEHSYIDILNTNIPPSATNFIEPEIFDHIKFEVKRGFQFLLDNSYKFIPPTKTIEKPQIKIETQEDNSVIFSRDFIIGLAIGITAFVLVGAFTGGFGFIGLGFLASAALAALSIPVVATAFAGLAAGFRALFKKEDDRRVLMKPLQSEKQEEKLSDNNPDSLDRKPPDNSAEGLEKKSETESAKTTTSTLPPPPKILTSTNSDTTKTHNQNQTSPIVAKKETSPSPKKSAYTPLSPIYTSKKEIHTIKSDPKNKNNINKNNLSQKNLFLEFAQFLEENEAWRLFIIKCAENANPEFDHSETNEFRTTLDTLVKPLTNTQAQIILHFQKMPLFTKSDSKNPIRNALVQVQEDEEETFNKLPLYNVIIHQTTQKEIRNSIITWWKHWSNLEVEDKKKITNEIKKLVKIRNSDNKNYHKVQK